MLDGLLAQVAGNVDIAGLASKVGLSGEQVEQAMSALGMAHAQPGDTVQAAAASTGLPADKLSEIVGHIGGEGSLGQFASMLGGGAPGGAGGGIGDMLGGLMGGKS